MKVSNIIVHQKSVPPLEEVVVEWRLIKDNGLVTLQARNLGGEFTGVLLIENGKLDHTFTPRVDGIELDDNRYIKLATGWGDE